MKNWSILIHTYVHKYFSKGQQNTWNTRIWKKHRKTKSRYRSLLHWADGIYAYICTYIWLVVLWIWLNNQVPLSHWAINSQFMTLLKAEEWKNDKWNKKYVKSEIRMHNIWLTVCFTTVIWVLVQGRHFGWRKHEYLSVLRLLVCKLNELIKLLALKNLELFPGKLLIHFVFIILN